MQKMIRMNKLIFSLFAMLATSITVGNAKADGLGATVYFTAGGPHGSLSLLCPNTECSELHIVKYNENGRLVSDKKISRNELEDRKRIEGLLKDYDERNLAYHRGVHGNLAVALGNTSYVKPNFEYIHQTLNAMKSAEYEGVQIPTSWESFDVIARLLSALENKRPMLTLPN